MADTGKRTRVEALMPELRRELEELARITSISSSESHEGPLLDAHDMVARLFADAGIAVERLDLPGTAPIVTGEIPAPEGAPTVLLYSHYDVVGPGDESLWDTPPFEPSERNGALFGRGTADSKSNVLAHVGALRAHDGRPPVGIKLLIEGHEEIGSGALPAYPAEDPELFRADVVVVGDAGSVRAGTPTLTVGLRGMGDVTVEVETLASAKHSGLYGGAAPDALLVLLHALASLHDERGDVAVAGLRREEWGGQSQTEEELRALAEVRDGLPLIGTGGLGSRVWSGPAITVIGIDATPVERSLNAVPARARARLNLRFHPEQDAVEGQAAVVEHLRAIKPFGIGLEVRAEATGNGYAARTAGPAYAAAREVWAATWGAEVVMAGSGGSIPIVQALAAAAPDAELLVVGTTDGFANIHGPNERVLLDEFEKATIAEADFFTRYAELYRALNVPE